MPDPLEQASAEKLRAEAAATRDAGEAAKTAAGAQQTVADAAKVQADAQAKAVQDATKLAPAPGLTADEVRNIVADSLAPLHDRFTKWDADLAAAEAAAEEEAKAEEAAAAKAKTDADAAAAAAAKAKPAGGNEPPKSVNLSAAHGRGRLRRFLYGRGEYTGKEPKA